EDGPAPGVDEGPPGGQEDGPGAVIERLRVSAAGLAGARYTAIPPLDVLGPRRARLVAALGSGAGAGARYVPPTEHGALLVADGRVEVCLQTGGGPWDFAALSVIVEEAGGRFSDLAGHHDIYGGGPVVFSNGVAHRAALEALIS
ncbi:MAG TPA: inositol monophosphatase family protein, partial [Acidimicrobiales bacterium]|nr:inositol monophosphatase family protein [Acidimicrobiales bacterium]